MADNEKKVADVKKAEKPAKADKPSIGVRIKNWLKTYKSELKKIVWASPKSVVNNTVIVVVFSLVAAVVIGLLDYAFSNGIVALGRLI